MARFLNVAIYAKPMARIPRITKRIWETTKYMTTRAMRPIDELDRALTEGTLSGSQRTGILESPPAGTADAVVRIPRKASVRPSEGVLVDWNGKP